MAMLDTGKKCLSEKPLSVFEPTFHLIPNYSEHKISLHTEICSYAKKSGSSFQSDQLK